MRLACIVELIGWSQASVSRCSPNACSARLARRAIPRFGMHTGHLLAGAGQVLTWVTRLPQRRPHQDLFTEMEAV